MPERGSSTWKVYGFAAAIAVLASILVWFLLGRVAAPDAAQPDRVLTQVLNRGTIRAGYVSYPPATIVDPATGAVSGIFPELLREIGRATSLKVEFTREVGYADMIAGLQSGKYDIVGGVWANPDRAKATTISIPVYYTGLRVWVRPAETRFTPVDSWSSLNRSEVRIAAIDGSTPMTVIREQFPNATLKSYPNQTSEAQLFLDVVQNKADVFFADPSQGAQFLAANPGKLKDISGGHPLRVFPSVYLMPAGEHQMQTMVDAALHDLISSGTADRIIRKYEGTPGAFMRPQLPYQEQVAERPK